MYFSVQLCAMRETHYTQSKDMSSTHTYNTYWTGIILQDSLTNYQGPFLTSTYFLIDSTSFDIVSNSMIEEKSLPKPSVSFPAEVTGSSGTLPVVDQAIEVLTLGVAIATEVAMATLGALQLLAEAQLSVEL